MNHSSEIEQCILIILEACKDEKIMDFLLWIRVCYSCKINLIEFNSNLNNLITKKAVEIKKNKHVSKNIGYCFITDIGKEMIVGY